jgi:hypothetical protein
MAGLSNDVDLLFVSVQKRRENADDTDDHANDSRVERPSRYQSVLCLAISYARFRPSEGSLAFRLVMARLATGHVIVQGISATRR